MTILLGLASRRFPNLFPAILGKYPGDTLWALMIFFALGAMFVSASTARIALIALLICGMVEFLKLYRADWLVSFRHTTFGHLIFGETFSWQNLAAYTIGIIVGAGIELLFLRDGTTKTSG